MLFTFRRGCALRKAILLAGSIVIASGQSMAQTTSSGASASDAGDTGGLQEIVVSARRQRENQQKVPMTVTAVTGTTIENSNITNTGELTFLAPSLQLTGNNIGRGATQFSIRGLGTTSFLHLISPSVSVVMDGIPLGQADLGFTDFVDLERVEVLAGPQGTLFGKNATAGIINIVSVKPELNTTSGSAKVSYANLIGSPTNASYGIGQATANLPTGQNSALRLNLSYTGYGPFLKQADENPGANIGKNQESVKAKWLWTPTDSLTFYLVGDYATSSGLGNGATTMRGPYNSGTNPDANLGIVPGPNNTTVGSNAPQNLGLHVGGIMAETDYTWSDFTATNIFGYRRYTAHVLGDNDATSLDNNIFEATFDFSQISDELRIQSSHNRFLDWQAGFLYFSGRYSRQDGGFSVTANGTKNGIGLPVPANPAACIPAGFSCIQNTGTQQGYETLYSKSQAVYGEGTVHLLPGFRGILGARGTFDQLRLAEESDNRRTVFISGRRGDFVAFRHNDNQDFSYRSGLEYDITNDVMAYGTYARGYKQGAYNTPSGVASINGAYVKPEYNRTGEIGIKSTLFDSRVRLNVDAYHADISGYQLQGYDSVLQAFYFLNAGSLEENGVEGEFDAKLPYHLLWSSGLAYNNAHFGNVVPVACFPRQTAAQGCVGGTTNINGNPLTSAPKFTFNGALDYDTPVSGQADFDFKVEYQYRTEVNYAVTWQPGTLQPAYSLVNMYVGLNASSDSWRVQIFCKNCLEQRFVNYISSSQGVNGAPSGYRQNFALESFRQIGITLSTKW
jgi:iron complex outermembrane receptor protein